MRQMFVLTVVLVMFVAGCAGTSGNMEDQGPRQIIAESGDFFVWAHAGRHYVVGSEESNKDFAAHHHLPYTKTLLGAGPQGETVVFEVDKKDPSYAERLIETYNETPFLIERDGDNFFVYKYSGRIYVLGSEETRASFVEHHHLPYTKTLIGAGPAGETVIFEVDKKDPELAQKLMKMYQS